MIAHSWHASSIVKAFGQDADGRIGNARIVAHGIPVGKQSATVHRRGNSRTTTYYTSRSLAEARRPIVAERHSVRRQEEADVDSCASAPSPVGDASFRSSSESHGETCSGAVIQEGASRVSVDAHRKPVHESLSHAQAQRFFQNTQGTHVQLCAEGVAANPVVSASEEDTAADTGIQLNGAIATSDSPGMIASQPVSQIGTTVSSTSADPVHVAACVSVTDANAEGSHAGHLRDDDGSDASSLASFLSDCGFSGLQAERLALELHGENSKFICISALEQQMQRLQNILPCMDVRALIVKDSQVLNVDASTAARRIVFLSSRLGHPDLTQLIKTAPQLLYAEEVEERLEHCMEKLLSLLPEDYPLESLQRLLVEAPTIIFRMDYYVSVTRLDDLPADLLNQLNSIRGGPYDTSCMI